MSYTYMYTLVDTTKKDRFADGCMDAWMDGSTKDRSIDRLFLILQKVIC